MTLNLLVFPENAIESRKAALIAELSKCNVQEAWVVAERFSKIAEEAASKDQIDSVSRQHTEGVYYTDFRLARAIVREATSSFRTSVPTFLEPCSGGGAFVLPYIDELFRSSSGSRLALEEIVSKCFIADSDQYAIQNFIEFFPFFSEKVFGHRIEFPVENVHVGDSLLATDGPRPTIRDFRAIFKQVSGFDIVVTNPPYKLLKRDRRRLAAAENYIDEYCAKLDASKAFAYNSGTRNLYKLFIEAIMEKWASKEATLGLLIPQGFLTDMQSSTLRRRLLDTSQLKAIVKLQEGNQYFKSIGQAFVALVTKMGSETEIVTFSHLDSKTGNFEVKSAIPRKELQGLSNKDELFQLEPQQLKLLTSLNRLKKIQDYKFIVNQRGEFDVSLDHSFLSKDTTGLLLVQGSKIARYRLSTPEKFVVEGFLARPKGKWIQKERIACQQISNSNQSQRLKWAKVPKGHVLANSTNFISIEVPNGFDTGADKFLDFLLGILNSKLLNSRFKALSSNNHVSNHEISQFPIGDLNPKFVDEISNAVRLFQFDDRVENDDKIEELVVRYFETSTARMGELN